jgi:hypothetical protein
VPRCQFGASVAMRPAGGGDGNRTRVSGKPEFPRLRVLPGRDVDARDRYARACELAERIRAEWEGLGYPLTAEGGATGRAVVTHPLVLLLQNAERDAQRFSRGREPVNERLTRLAMAAESALGLRGAVVRRYQALRDRLRDDLGLEPERATRALFRRLLGPM